MSLENRLVSRKRQHPDSLQPTPQHQPKRQKSNAPASTYWDNLSKIWLTENAVRELNRRNIRSQVPQSHRPVTRRLQAEAKTHRGSLQFARDLIRDCLLDY
ncbi:hypothetical protein ACJ73_06757 [Blastomyces percursus]|uniref:Uncharacterized protein n=1 Tax=Blastomyces percursus TaxID=1658174 RepID=A0A1J9Q013_9EURO|nr:hypothetical protein ACJ73_06757 [Blastomyces percursus]